MLSTLRNLTKSQYDVSMQTPCKHIPSHTFTHLDSVCFRKNTTFVCLGGFSTCFATFTYCTKVMLLFKVHLCIFLLNRLGTPSWLEQISAWAGSTVCRMMWRQEQSAVCVPVVTERSLRLNGGVLVLRVSQELWLSSFSVSTCGCVCVWKQSLKKTTVWTQDDYTISFGEVATSRAEKWSQGPCAKS